MDIGLFSAYEWSGSNSGRIFAAGSVVVLALVNRKEHLPIIEDLANRGRIKCRLRRADTPDWDGGSDAGSVSVIQIGENHVYPGTGVLLVCAVHPAGARSDLAKDSGREIGFLGAALNAPMPTWTKSTAAIPVLSKAWPSELRGGTHVCLNTIYSARLSPLWLIEFLLYYKYIGAHRVHMYNYGDIHSDAVAALQLLDSSTHADGFVVNHDFRGIGCGHRVNRCENGQVPLWSHGQLFAIHDCAFRASLAGAKYAISGDIDEVLYVLKDHQLTEALDAVFHAQNAGRYKGFLLDGQQQRACSMTHTFTVLGEGLLTHSSTSLALTGIRLKARAQQNGVGSGGHCKWALDLGVLRDQTLPLHIHWAGSRGTSECSNVPWEILHMNHLEPKLTLQGRGRARGPNSHQGTMRPNPRLMNAQANAPVDRVLVPAAVELVSRRLTSPPGNATGDELAAIHRCWLEKLTTVPDQSTTLSYLMPRNVPARVKGGLICCSEHCLLQATSPSTSQY